MAAAPAPSARANARARQRSGDEERGASARGVRIDSAWRLVARDGGEIRATITRASRCSLLRATFDRDCVAARRFKPMQPPTAALSSNAQFFRLLALLWL